MSGSNVTPNFAWLKTQALAFMHSPANDLNMPKPEPAFAEPLFGVAAGLDPLWQTLKEAVGPFHWMPKEAFDCAYPGNDAEPKDLAVFVWILPQTEATKADNRKETRYPSERWIRNRIFGEANVNFGLARHLVNALHNNGVQAFAPVLLPQWHQEPSPKYTFASLWSERHAAHIAGLGTFGLSDGLITPLGKAVRIGSLVARLPLESTPRPYVNHHEYCLYYQNGGCRVCERRCPVGSISAQNGRDKIKCKQYTLVEVVPPYVKQKFGLEGYGCGLCQTRVPCESGIPAPLKK